MTNTYSAYLASAPDTLPIDNADRIFTQLRDSIDEHDEDEMELFQDFLKKCTAYASRRATWNLINREQRISTDDMRTLEHDAVIRSINILARLLKTHGKDAGWRDLLGDEKEHRKRIGDFACYVALMLGLGAR